MSAWLARAAKLHHPAALIHCWPSVAEADAAQMRYLPCRGCAGCMLVMDAADGGAQQQQQQRCRSERAMLFAAARAGTKVHQRRSAAGQA